MDPHICGAQNLAQKTRDDRFKVSIGVARLLAPAVAATRGQLLRWMMKISESPSKRSCINFSSSFSCYADERWRVFMKHITDNQYLISHRLFGACIYINPDLLN